MIKIDLITGFLGSGKTTFIKKYAAYLLSRGMRIGILENDFGAVNVDLMLLQELRGDHCELEMIAGACDKDCYRRRFKTKLISMAMCGYDRILVEPSGIFDVDDFFDILYEEPLDRWYEIGSVIAIVDAALEDDFSPASDYYLAEETANAGCVILSRTQEASKEDIENTRQHLNRVMESVRCVRRFDDDLLCKDWKDFDEADFARIKNSGYVAADYVKKRFGEEKGFQSKYFLNLPLTLSEAQAAAERIFADPACGRVFRVKGFVQEAGTWMELNAAHGKIQTRPIAEGQAVLIVIGENLDEAQIAGHFSSSNKLK